MQANWPTTGAAGVVDVGVVVVELVVDVVVVDDVDVEVVDVVVVDVGGMVDDVVVVDRRRGAGRRGWRFGLLNRLARG